MMQQDLFGKEEVRQRIEKERKLAKRIEIENAKRDKRRVRKAEYGTGAHELTRRGAPETSKEAAEKVDTKGLEYAVHCIVHRLGEPICSEVEKHFPDRPRSSITARFSALKRKGLVSGGPDKRLNERGNAEQVLRSLKAPEKPQ